MATDSTATAPDVSASFLSDSERSCSCAAPTPLLRRWRAREGARAGGAESKRPPSASTAMGAEGLA